MRFSCNKTFEDSIEIEIQRVAATGFMTCYDMEVVENCMYVFDGTEKRQGERLDIYTGNISPCSRNRVSDL